MTEPAIIGVAMVRRTRRLSTVALVLSCWLAPSACATGGGPVGPSTVPQPSTLTIASVPVDLPAYDRADWRHWIDADGDCQDTRAEVLIQQSLITVLFRDLRICVADAGRWEDPYTRLSILIAGDLDVDHLVPLVNAHRSGGWNWSAARKQAYANDLSYPLHLIAVTSSANRSKSDRGPEEWRPSSPAFWCEYSAAWIHVKRTWSLTAT